MLEDLGVTNLVALGVLILLSGFFSGSEAALLSVQRVRLQHMVSTQVPGAARVARMVTHPGRLLPPILLGNNLVNTATAALGTAMALSVIDDKGQGILAATIGITVVVLVVGETIPKTVGARYPERLALLVALPIQVVEWAFLPAVFLLQRITGAVARLMGSSEGLQAVVTEEEIKTLISVGREIGVVEHGEAEMIRRVFQFGDRQVREVMTPRPEIVWVKRDATLGEFLAIYDEHYHTRFPVFEGGLDNVMGILSVKDVMRAQARGALSTGDSMTTAMRPFHFVPETKLVGELFSEMRTAGHQMTMVADEFGGVAGLVTLKQLVEEIVGPVGEEGERPAEEVVALDENTFAVDAGIQVEEANERLNLGLPEGDYETVAGFILERLGRIPEENDQFTFRDLHFRITQMRGVKVERVMVTRLQPPPE